MRLAPERDNRRMPALARARAVAALLVVLLSAAPAEAAWSLLAGFPIAKAGDTSNVPATASASTTGADLLVVFLAWYGGGSACTPADSASNTWNALTTAANGSPGFASGRWFYASNGATTNPPATSGTHTFSCSGGNADYPSFIIYAFSGSVGGSSFDVQNTNIATGVTTIGTNNVTPSSTNNLSLIGTNISGGASPQNPAATGYTVAALDWVTNVNEGVAGGYKAGGLGNPESATWTWTNSADAATGIATFKASGGATSTGCIIGGRVIRPQCSGE